MEPYFTPALYMYIICFCSLLLQLSNSVDFVEEIYELLEVYFIVRLNSRYFYHCIKFIVCNTFAKNLKDFFEIIRTYVSLSIFILMRNQKYLLLSIKHWEGKNEIIFCLLVLRARISYDIDELIKFKSLLAVRKLHYWRCAWAGYLLWPTNFGWTIIICSPIFIILIRFSAFWALYLTVYTLRNCASVEFDSHLSRVRTWRFVFILLHLAQSPRAFVQSRLFRSSHGTLRAIGVLSWSQLYYTVIVWSTTVVGHSSTNSINNRGSFWWVVLTFRWIIDWLGITDCMSLM